MHSKWQLVRDLFERALEEQPADLDVWLAERTDDAEVHAEVRSLLEQHRAAGGFLTEPVQDRFPSLLDDGDAAALNEGAAFPPGHVIGHYRIVRQLLPSGGMGRVYLAIDLHLGHNVVLKTLAAQFAGDPAYEERLRREAQALKDLDHPGICRFYTFEKYDGVAFIVTEYIDGRTLREEIATGSRPTRGEVLRTARDIAAALASAHARKIVHRDLKPANVMRIADGGIKIIDFGIARIDYPDADPHAGLTQSDVLVGTLAYMAPERLNRERGDARSDVFSFGVMLYELACGVHPFKGESAADVIARILYSDVLPIEERCPGLPVTVCSVIERCLKKSPAQRFESASEILAALSVDPRLPTSTPDPRIPAVVRWWRAHQATVIGLYFLACAFAWLIKQELGSAALALAVFGIVSAAATVGGVVRGHLLFIGKRIPRGMMAAELLRSGPITLGADAVIAIALCVDGALLLVGESGRHVAAALSAGFGIGVLVARLRLEPSTTRDAFPKIKPAAEPLT
jgi:hypothetical protein